MLNESWLRICGNLTAFKEIYGNCDVPFKWEDNPGLGIWVSNQRIKYKNKILSSECVMRLEQLGFVWDPLSAAWEEMFADLTAYKGKYGHCDVPSKWEDNPGLGVGVSNQRVKYKDKILTSECVMRLEQLGFVWDQHAVAWEEMFAILTAYKGKYGDCDVPVKWEDNTQFGSWCARQRSAYKENKLSPERLKRLRDIGFQFALRKSKRD